MVGHPSKHLHSKDLVSSFWGSYFFYPEPSRKPGNVLNRASSFAKRKQSIGELGRSDSTRTTPSAALNEMKKTSNLKRVSSLRSKEETENGGSSRAASALGSPGSAWSMLGKSRASSPINITCDSGDNSPDRSSPVGNQTPLGSSSGCITPSEHNDEFSTPRGQSRINTLWGTCIKSYAKMCIPDLDVLVDYPIDYKYPIFAKDKHGEVIASGFFPADPVSLHHNPPPSSAR